MGTRRLHRQLAHRAGPYHNEILDRVVALQTAVKFAREEANNTDVVEQRIGASVFGYLFG